MAEVAKGKYTIKAECPKCASGDVSLLVPEKLREEFIGDETEVDILCPSCGTVHKGKVCEEEVNRDVG
jgi:uncharacterized Zn finger protein